MKRKEWDYLLSWKISKTRKPLIVRGARQVGKTWLLREFGKKQYEQMAYLNFESSAALKDLFQQDFNIERILLGIQIETGIKVEPENTLIVLDEIQEAPKALTSLKYFRENAPEYHIVSAGSLLGVALNRETSFPVGKVDFLDLYPLTYPEFLEAMGEKQLVELLEKEDWHLIKSFNAKYKQLLRQYFYIGGMPEVVFSFSQNKDFTEARDIQRTILAAYEQDFSKHAPNSIVPRIRMLWNSIPAQLAKENKKFIYGALRKGARAKDYELALTWLKDCGLIHQVFNVAKPAIPLKAYEDHKSFKLFIVDVGLLSAMTNLDARTLLVGNSIFQEFKGSLTEQYVLQQLAVQKNTDIYYWSSEKARTEIDFLLQISGQVIPLEVKAEENLQAKSLRFFSKTYNPPKAIRASMSDYREESWMYNIPLYAISSIQ
ncbi:MAG TPA: ATP-binding protein [Salinimicrobium sp.]|nr:ATP-binding protein [Salinimicrobium sp.]